MSMDIRKLLHKYPKLKLAKENAKKGIAELEKRDRIYRADLNFFLRGTEKSDRTADTVVEDEAVHEKIKLLEDVVDRLDTLLTAIEGVISALEPLHAKIVDYRYFKGYKVPEVCAKISLDTEVEYTERQFYYAHSIVLEDFQIALGGLLTTYDDEFLDRVMFIVGGTRLDGVSNKHKRYNDLKFVANL